MKTLLKLFSWVLENVRASHELCFYLCALWQADNVDIPCNFQTPVSIWEKCKKGKYNKCRFNCNSTKGYKSKVSVLCVKSFSLHRLARLESLSGSSLVLEVQHTEWFEIFCMFSAHYEKPMETWCLKPFICMRLMLVSYWVHIESKVDKVWWSLLGKTDTARHATPDSEGTREDYWKPRARATTSGTVHEA